jgi:hypothetical protein
MLESVAVTSAPLPLRDRWTGRLLEMMKSMPIAFVLLREKRTSGLGWREDRHHLRLLPDPDAIGSFLQQRDDLRKVWRTSPKLRELWLADMI